MFGTMNPIIDKIKYYIPTQEIILKNRNSQPIDILSEIMVLYGLI